MQRSWVPVALDDFSARRKWWSRTDSSTTACTSTETGVVASAMAMLSRGAAMLNRKAATRGEGRPPMSKSHGGGGVQREETAEAWEIAQVWLRRCTDRQRVGAHAFARDSGERMGACLGVPLAPKFVYG
jgi:hypothetical protein